MLLRLTHDRQAIFQIRHYDPKRSEVSGEVVQKFTELYGSRLSEHLQEIAAEIDHRTAEALRAAPIDLVAMAREALGLALQAYAQIPLVRTAHAKLFEDPTQKAAAS
jgi:hypothetical protein